MSLSEADVRSKLVDPALHTRGWTEDFIQREQGAHPALHPKNHVRVDYVLRLKVQGQPAAIPVALLEAKAENRPPEEGLVQAQRAAFSPTLNVPFLFSTNGHSFVEFDRFTGRISTPRPLSEFPTPRELLKRYTIAMGLEAGSGLEEAAQLAAETEEDRTVAKEFARESGEAQRLVAEKPPGWPWLLTAELLLPRLKAVYEQRERLAAKMEDGERASDEFAYLPVEQADRMKAKSRIVNSKMKQITTLLESNLPRVWRYGDPVYIKQTVEMIANAMSDLAKEESVLRVFLQKVGKRNVIFYGSRPSEYEPTFVTFLGVAERLKDLKTDREWKIVLDGVVIREYQIQVTKKKASRRMPWEQPWQWPR